MLIRQKLCTNCLQMEVHFVLMLFNQDHFFKTWCTIDLQLLHCLWTIVAVNS